MKKMPFRSMSATESKLRREITLMKPVVQAVFEWAIGRTPIAGVTLPEEDKLIKAFHNFCKNVKKQYKVGK